MVADKYQGKLKMRTRFHPSSRIVARLLRKEVVFALVCVLYFEVIYGLNHERDVAVRLIFNHKYIQAREKLKLLVFFRPNSTDDVYWYAVSLSHTGNKVKAKKLFEYVIHNGDTTMSAEAQQSLWNMNRYK